MEPPRLPVHQMYTKELLARLQSEFHISDSDLKPLAAELESRIAPPRRSETAAPLPVDRLRRENVNLLKAFRKVLESMPRIFLPEGVLGWVERSNALDDEQLASQLRDVLQHLESRLGDNQLSQIYAGTITFFDQKMQRNQALPINWEGMRFRLLAAAQEDLTPRGHLNYFCSYAAKTIELFADRGVNRSEMRRIVEEVMQQAQEHLRIELQASVVARFHQAINELTDSLRVIHQLILGLLRQVRAAMAGKPTEAVDTLTRTLTGLDGKNAKLTDMMRQLSDVGVPLPPGLETRLRTLVENSRQLTHFEQYLENPRKIQEFLQRVEEVKRQARGVGLEIRRLRRQTLQKLQRIAPQLSRAQDEVPLQRVCEHPRRLLMDAARELLWSIQDLDWTLDQRGEGPSSPELAKLKGLAKDLANDHPASQELATLIGAAHLDPIAFRLASKRVLEATMRVIQVPPPVSTVDQPETDLLEGLSDLAESHRRLSMVVEGEDHRKLEELPAVLTDLHRELGVTDPGRVIQVNITAALEREAKCRRGVIHLSVAARLDNLYKPLRELFKATLDRRHPSQELWNVRNRAMQAMEVTEEADQERSRNDLAELTIIPLVRLFVPCDPRYGRSRSDLEKRLQQGPVAGVLPSAVLFGTRRPNSLEDLGNPELSRQLHLRAKLLTNRSGLVGEVLGLHPWWPTILASDEAKTLAAELRLLLVGSSGVGLVGRILYNNEEYHELERLDQDEKENEASLLLEAIQSPDSFMGLQNVLFEGACWLANRELEVELRKNRQPFLFNQLELLRTLNVEDPLELTKPATIATNPQWLATGWELLGTLDLRQQELCLLQWLHRRLLSPLLLTPLLKSRFPETSDLTEAMPDLVQELHARYVWLLQNPGRNSERKGWRQLLSDLGYGDGALATENGLVLQGEIREKLSFLKTLSMNRPKGVVGAIQAFFRGTNRYALKLEQEIRSRLEQLRDLGMKREYRLLSDALRPIATSRKTKVVTGKR